MNGHGISFGSDKNILNVILVMVVRLYEYIKNTELYALNERTVCTCYGPNSDIKFLSP